MLTGSPGPLRKGLNPDQANRHFEQAPTDNAHWSMLMFRACFGSTLPRANSFNTWSESLQAATFCNSWKALAVQRTVNKVDGPGNQAVNLRARARGKWVGHSRNRVKSGWLPTPRERISTQCAKVAPNLPESGITCQFLVSPEHHPSAAVPPTSVGEERSLLGHCSKFRQRSPPSADRRRAWCGTTLDEDTTDSRRGLPERSAAGTCNTPVRE